MRSQTSIKRPLLSYRNVIYSISKIIKMKPAERLEWLQTEIDNIVKRYKTESTHYKKSAFRLKIVSVFLAAIITVLLGFKLQSTSLTAAISNIALVLSAAITVLSAYEAFLIRGHFG